MATFTRTWNAAYEQSPADTDDASEGAQRIREVKTDTQERLVIDHSWAGDGSDGAHKKLTLLEQAADPATVANQGFLYTKDDSGDTELYYKDAGGTVMKITQNGLINPSLLTAAQEPSTLDNAKVDASVGTNALTVALKDLAGSDPSAGSPVKIALRDTTVTSGKYNIRSIVAALSVVAPQGATLGYANAETHDVQVFAIDNAGTVELAIGYFADAGGSMPDEAQLASTTIIDSSSDSADTLYSTTARSNVPVRHIGTINVQTGATAGDWSVTPARETLRSRPRILAAQLPSIDQGLVGPAAIGQGELKTATSSGSQTTAAASGLDFTINLVGGTYAWWTTSGAIIIGQNRLGADNGNTAAGDIGAHVGEDSTFYWDERYVQASPPYRLGPVFVYLQITPTGLVEGVVVSLDPTWACHGPTDITPEYFRNGKAYRKIMSIAGVPMSMLDKARRLAFVRGELQSEKIEQEITLDYKDSDAQIAPHPFYNSPAITNETILLEPGTPLMLRLLDIITSADASVVRNMILDGDIKFDSEDLNVPGSPIRTVRARLR